MSLFETTTYKLRDYQQEASDAAIDFFNNPRKKSALIVLPTGAGKSILIADIANRLSGNTLVFQPQKELLQQNYEKFVSYGNIASIFSASMGSKEISKVTYATIGSVINKKHLFDMFDNVICDEAHCTNAKQGMYKEFFNYLGDKKYLGLTATPYRSHTNSFGTELRFLTRTRPRVFEELIYYSQISDLKKMGFLCDLEYYNVGSFDTNRLVVNSTRTDYTDYSVKEYYSQISFEEQVADVAERLVNAGRKHILIFTKFVGEAETISRRLGDKAASVSADMHPRDRARILREFKEGKIKIVSNVGIFTTGFDFPALDTVLLARPTRSLAMFYQMVGRAFRPHESKKSAWIVDMCGTYNRFGKVEELHLSTEGHGKWFYESNGKQLTNVYLD